MVEDGWLYLQDSYATQAPRDGHCREIVERNDLECPRCPTTKGTVRRVDLTPSQIWAIFDTERLDGVEIRCTVTCLPVCHKRASRDSEMLLSWTPFRG